MKKFVFLIVMALFAISSFGFRPPMIDRGKIDDHVIITIHAEYNNNKFSKPMDIALKPNTFFSLPELGFEANPAPSEAVLSPKGYRVKSYKWKTYDLSMEDTETGKKYYGRLAFFNPLRQTANDATATYYKIQISDRLADAVDGGIAYAYEYCNSSFGKVPTWILWVSDLPLK